MPAFVKLAFASLISSPFVRLFGASQTKFCWLLCADARVALALVDSGSERVRTPLMFLQWCAQSTKAKLTPCFSFRGFIVSTPPPLIALHQSTGALLVRTYCAAAHRARGAATNDKYTAQMSTTRRPPLPCAQMRRVPIADHLMPTHECRSRCRHFQLPGAFLFVTTKNL